MFYVTVTKTRALATHVLCLFCLPKISFFVICEKVRTALLFVWGRDSSIPETTLPPLYHEHMMHHAQIATTSWTPLFIVRL